MNDYQEKFPIPMDSMLSQTSETEARDDVDAKLEKVHSA